MRRLLPFALILLAACPKAPEAVVPPPPPPPPLPKVPPGCEQNLAGSYHHQDDATFRYEVADDGASVTIKAFRQYGQTREEIASSAATITLQRTATGLRGAALTQAKTLSGAKTCTVTFPYEVTACTAAGLTLRTVHEVRLTEACEPEDPLHPDLAENVLVRDPTPAAVDAGPAAVPDAGAPADAGMAAPLDAGAIATPDAGSAAPDAGPIAADAGVSAPVVTQGVDAGAEDAGRP